MKNQFYKQILIEEKGSATIIALIVVGVAAVLITGLIWRQQLQIRSIENSRHRTQAVWLQRGMVDFARLVLAQDIRNNRFDHLGEAWTLPLSDVKVEDFLKNVAIPDELKSVSVSGGISDAQGLFNLSNLWIGSLQAINPPGVLSYARLLTALELDAGLANQTAQTLMQTQIPLNDVNDLISIPGYSANTIKALRPYVAILPNASSININTASPEVLMAAFTGLSRSAANKIIQYRSTSPARNLEDISGLLTRSGAGINVSMDDALVNVNSQYWFARSEITLDSRIFRNTTLIHRELSPKFGNNTQVIWTRANRIYSE